MTFNSFSLDFVESSWSDAVRMQPSWTAASAAREFSRALRRRTSSFSVPARSRDVSARKSRSSARAFWSAAIWPCRPCNSWPWTCAFEASACRLAFSLASAFSLSSSSVSTMPPLWDSYAPGAGAPAASSASSSCEDCASCSSLALSSARSDAESSTAPSADARPLTLAVAAACAKAAGCFAISLSRTRIALLSVSLALMSSASLSSNSAFSASRIPFAASNSSLSFLILEARSSILAVEASASLTALLTVESSFSF
mmetsp:Transcript_72165/g.188216  ORF Transcript_72165/g.188216 Transcript_72165/m.188216 type:complete len:257 (+) Transcript_72165:1252-2022(+)